MEELESESASPVARFVVIGGGIAGVSCVEQVHTYRNVLGSRYRLLSLLK